MKRKKNLPAAVEESTHTAAERTAELRDKAMATVQPWLEQAQEKVGPYAHDAKVKSAAYASDALDKAQPAINDALDKVTPTVDAARVHVQTELLPKIAELLRTAAELPAAAAVGVELSRKELKKANKAARKQAKKDAKAFGKRSKKLQDQAVATLSGEKKRGKGKTIALILVGAGLIGVAVAALRKYLAGGNDAGWAAYDPSPAYSGPSDEGTMSNDEVAKAAQDAPVAADDVPVAGDDVPAAGGTGTVAADAVVTPEAPETTEPEQFAEQIAPEQQAEKNDDSPEPPPFADTAAAEGVGSDSTSTYGEGSYVGPNPPEGFDIKGNERSMKYHVKGSGGFERTIPDVWFATEEAAQAAGFTRAQR